MDKEWTRSAVSTSQTVHDQSLIAVGRTAIRQERAYRHSRTGENPVPLDSRLRGNDVDLIQPGFPSAARLNNLPESQYNAPASEFSNSLAGGAVVKFCSALELQSSLVPIASLAFGSKADQLKRCGQPLRRLWLRTSCLLERTASFNVGRDIVIFAFDVAAMIAGRSVFQLITDCVRPITHSAF